jgi:hypothetical protein
MDEELLRLRRQHEATPADDVVARRLVKGLVRAGRRDEARDLYRFKFRCSKKWDDLAREEPEDPFSLDVVRHCSECQRDVHLVKNVSEVREQVSLGHSVAATEEARTAFVDAAIDDPTISAAADPKRPCVVDGPCLVESDVGFPMALAFDATIPVPYDGPLSSPASPEPDASELEIAFEPVVPTAAELETLTLERAAFDHYARGDLVAAIQGFDAALAREPSRAFSLSQRAVIRFLTGDRSGARADLVAANAGFPKGYMALWIAGLFGDTAPLEPFAGDIGWPGPLIRSYLDRESEGSVLALALSTGDSREAQAQQLCEAHGYLGLRAERERDLVRARRHYEACVATGVPGYVEAVWSRLALATPGRLPVDPRR